MRCLSSIGVAVADVVVADGEQFELGSMWFALEEVSPQNDYFPLRHQAEQTSQRLQRYLQYLKMLPLELMFHHLSLVVQHYPPLCQLRVQPLQSWAYQQLLAQLCVRWYCFLQYQFQHLGEIDHPGVLILDVTTQTLTYYYPVAESAAL